MDESGSWAQGFRFYEQLRVVDDMNDLGSHELKPLNAMNNLGLGMIWTIISHELMALNVKNDSRCYEQL